MQEVRGACAKAATAQIVGQTTLARKKSFAYQIRI